jgi:hypothetical protein
LSEQAFGFEYRSLLTGFDIHRDKSLSFRSGHLDDCDTSICIVALALPSTAVRVKTLLATRFTIPAWNHARNRDLSADLFAATLSSASGTPSRDRLYMRTLDAQRPPLLMAALCFDGRLNNLPLNCA